MPSLSLYIHLPWCERKCPYCDFNSYAWHDGVLPESNYIDALQRDLAASLPQLNQYRLISIFFGGGTPSLFTADGIANVLEIIFRNFEPEPEVEISMEANPGSAEVQRFRDYRAAGVNRLSIGVQSFADQQLQALGRIHTADDASRAVTAAMAVFDNVNLDLMYALPEQSLPAAMADLGQAIAHQPRHVSWYELTIEPNTEFYARPPSLPGSDQAAQMQMQGVERLADAGFDRYEVSAFARPGYQCRHNRNYWEFGDYLGIGAGAHSKLTGADGVIRRSVRHRLPERYMALAGDQQVVSNHVVGKQDAVFEFMLNACRLSAGFSKALLVERSGADWPDVEQTMRHCEQRGFLEVADDRVRPTALGERFLNDLVQEFLPTQV